MKVKSPSIFVRIRYNRGLYQTINSRIEDIKNGDRLGETIYPGGFAKVAMG